MIQLENVSQVYRSRRGEVRALDEVSLTVRNSEFVVVKGPSGSGKSTLLLTIAGMIRPTRGRVLVNDADIYHLSNRERARFRAQNVGFVFQSYHLVPYLSALENVLLPTMLVSPDARRHTACQLLNHFGIGQRLAHKPAELSTGERQRTAVARALSNRPWLLLADEPTGNLDPETGLQIIEYLAEFHRQGGTVVLVTHERWAEEYAERTISIRHGRIEEGS